MRILLIEDDHRLGEAVRDHLAAAGHGVDWMARLDDAGAATDTVVYDLILLDLHLPDGRGLDLLADLRRRGSQVPVIILTARDQVSDRIAGLNHGADDYLVKPFDLDELTARIAAVCRRYVGDPNPLRVLGPLEIDQPGRRIRVAGQAVDLTAREWALLDALAHRPGTVVAKERLEEALYAFGAEVESNAVEVHVSRLRKKLGRERIATVRGLGYRLAVP